MSLSNSREDFLNELKRSSEVKITVNRAKDDEEIFDPVWFVLEGRKMILVPSKGFGHNWFKDLVKDPRIELNVGNSTIASEATVVRDPSTEKAVEEV